MFTNMKDETSTKKRIKKRSLNNFCVFMTASEKETEKLNNFGLYRNMIEI